MGANYEGNGWAHVCTQKPLDHAPNCGTTGLTHGEGICAFSWSSQTAQGQELPCTLPTALWLQPSPHPLGALLIKGEALLENTSPGNWTRAMGQVGIQTKTERIKLLNENTDTQDPVPAVSQHRTGSKMFQKFPTPRAGDAVSPRRMSMAPVKVHAAHLQCPSVPPQHRPGSCPQ